MQIFISLRLEHTDKLRLQLRLGLVAFGVLLDRGVFGGNGAVGGFGYDIEVGHYCPPFFSKPSKMINASIQRRTLIKSNSQNCFDVRPCNVQ